MIKLTDKFDNFVVVNPDYITYFKMCDLGHEYGLGIEITLNNGEKFQVRECLFQLKKVLDIKETPER